MLRKDELINVNDPSSFHHHHHIKTSVRFKYLKENSPQIQKCIFRYPSRLFGVAELWRYQQSVCLYSSLIEVDGPQFVVLKLPKRYICKTQQKCFFTEILTRSLKIIYRPYTHHPYHCAGINDGRNMTSSFQLSECLVLVLLKSLGGGCNGIFSVEAR